jgi:myo-inositol 2-dehydrogenase / D-chiro-inositol 1-dehydrogenase
MSQSKRCRREFLKETIGLAGAAVATPYIFTAAAKAAESKNDRLNVAAIGVGGRGFDVAHQAAALGNMVAVADVHLGNARKFADCFNGKCQVYQDYRKLLDRKDIAAVTIATPDHWHVKIAIDAMRFGKDVYCEKPLTLTIEQGKQICKVAEQTGRVVQIGTQQRSEFGNAFLEAVALARGGRLGPKLTGRASIGLGPVAGPFQNAEPPAELDWELWLGPAPKVPFCPSRINLGARHWFDYSGGHVTDWGVHNVDIALWALGGDDTGPIEVEGRGSFPLGAPLMLDYLLGKKSVEQLPNSYNTASTFDCKMLLPNGNVVLFNVMPCDDYLEGANGHVAVNRNGIRGKFVDDFKSRPADKDWLNAEVAKLYRGMPIQGHMANFFHCIKTRQKPISDVWSHCNSMNACHMANIAMLLGRKVRWDLEKKEFIGDAEANRLMHRPQRAPYAIEV